MFKLRTEIYKEDWSGTARGARSIGIGIHLPVCHSLMILFKSLWISSYCWAVFQKPS